MAKNPTEIYTSVQQDKSGRKKALVAEAHLSLGEIDKTSLEYVGYSRFVLTIIDKAEGRAIFPKANIPQSDIDGIYHKKNAVVQGRVLHEMLAFGGGSEESEDPVIPFGPHKKKRVSEAAAGMTAEEVSKQISVFSANLEKYPGNRGIIEAFERELKKQTTGVATPMCPQSPTITLRPVVLYEQKVKFLRSNADEHGNCFVYSVVMEYNPSMRYPYEVRIENGYAPVVETSTGGFNVEVSKMVNKTSASFRMSVEDFEGLIDKMYQTSTSFDRSMFATQYREARRRVATAAGVKPDLLAKAETRYVPNEILTAEELNAQLSCAVQEALREISNK